MSCYAEVHIIYSKELEDKIRGIPGIIPIDNTGEFKRVKVPEELFNQHKKENDAHRWVRKNDGVLYYYDPIKNPGKWEYYSHGFEIWLNFEGCITFVAPCGWDIEHGRMTFIDIEEWINANLGHTEMLKEIVTT